MPFNSSRPCRTCRNGPEHVLTYIDSTQLNCESNKSATTSVTHVTLDFPIEKVQGARGCSTNFWRHVWRGRQYWREEAVDGDGFSGLQTVASFATALFRFPQWWVDDGVYFGNGVGRKSALLGVFANDLLMGRIADAVDLVAGNELFTHWISGPRLRRTSHDVWEMACN